MPKLELELTDELTEKLNKLAKFNLVGIKDVAINALVCYVKKDKNSYLKILKVLIPSIVSMLESTEGETEEDK